MIRAGIMLLAVAFTTAVAAASLAQTPPGHVYTLANAPGDLRPLVDQAMALIAPLEREFLIDVTSALRTDGPSGAMKSCHLQPTIRELQIAREKGILVGRTSDRLRNPTNAPRPWAAPIVAEYAGRRAAGIEGFVVDIGDRVGVLRPVVEEAMCSGCHGRADRLSPKVVEALKDRYPVDHAVGFEDGTIRGWFWVELPKPKQRSQQ